MNNTFLKACARESTEYTPVWMMRQAGRHLPEYREIRSKVDFLTLCKTPALAAEVTLQPVDILGVDAAIIFSDILVVPEAMGMELKVDEGKGGPNFPAPLRRASNVAKLRVPDAGAELRYVMDALSLARKQLEGKVPLIGFSGAPWTLAAYMIEGRGSASFRHAKEMLYNEPAILHGLLEKLTRSIVSYLEAQVAAGAQAVQIFDTWGGILAPDTFREFSLRYIATIVAALKGTGVPVIVFCKNCGHALEEIAGTGCQVVGLDWTVDIGGARRAVGGRVALQGNLDPMILYARPEKIREEVKAILSKFGKGNGHIFNLGHGISPDVPVPHTREFINAVHEESKAFHHID